MNRRDAVTAIEEGLSGEEAIITTVGLISRHFYEVGDDENVFYMAGSMGMASSIGVGVALSKPKQPVTIIDGDGSLLLNFGALATVAHHSPSNFMHIVLDNAAYGSCSREPSMAETVDLAEMADTAGYASTTAVSSSAELERTITEMAPPMNGPSFIHAHIETGGERHPARILDLPFYAERFSTYLQETSNGE